MAAHPPGEPPDASDVSDEPQGPGSSQVPGPGRPHASQPHFRFWIDYQVLSSPLSTRLLERALRAVGGACTGGPPKLDPVTAAVQKHKDYGYMHMGEWDFLWSITAKAMLAAEILRPGQLVSIIPGFLSITRKTSLVSNMRLTLGDDAAFAILPRTFKLPDEMDDWADWVQRHPERDTGLWMLKNNRQRGTGLRLVRTRDAFAACFETTSRPGLEGMTLYRWYLAQQYIPNPMLLNGCKFGVRLWVLVTGIKPLRLYVHRNGLVLLSSAKYDAAVVSSPGGDVPPGHVTNYAQNENGDVWSLAQLAAHMGGAAYARLWDAMLTSTAHVFAAALPRVSEVQAQTAVPPQSCFQFFGLDFLVDAAGKPWLLEVNATPSMKVEHEDAALKRLIHDQKWPVVRDMVAMLGLCPERWVRFPTSQAQRSVPLDRLHQELGYALAAGTRPRLRPSDRNRRFSGPAPKELKDLRFLPGELARRGGFLPLMHKLPVSAAGGLRTIPWQPLDDAVRAYCATRAYQQCLAPV